MRKNQIIEINITGLTDSTFPNPSKIIIAEPLFDDCVIYEAYRGNYVIKRNNGTSFSSDDFTHRVEILSKKYVADNGYYLFASFDSYDCPLWQQILMKYKYNYKRIK